MREEGCKVFVIGDGRLRAEGEGALGRGVVVKGDGGKVNRPMAEIAPFGPNAYSLQVLRTNIPQSRHTIFDRLI